jgi:hypothetical protein
VIGTGLDVWQIIEAYRDSVEQMAVGPRAGIRAEALAL